MLLAPFALIDPMTTRANKPPCKSPVVPGWLIVWALAGALSLCCFPALRSDGLGGLSVPFWLVGAPVLDIAWVLRRRWLGQLGQLARVALARRYGRHSRQR